MNQAALEDSSDSSLYFTTALTTYIQLLRRLRSEKSYQVFPFRLVPLCLEIVFEDVFAIPMKVTSTKCEA